MSAQSTKKVSVATVWLDGCSGCHMSFLDIDERLIELASSIDIVYSPLVDTKIFPEQVDLALVEGLLTDERARVNGVNTRRRDVLATVPFVVLVRRGTVALEASVPARQLFPAVVASPVPAALESTATIPPELRELTALLREAPPAWLPSVAGLLARVERPQHFIDLALHMRVRAFGRLQTPPPPSSPGWSSSATCRYCSRAADGRISDPCLNC